jgi:hypothetical protein
MAPRAIDVVAGGPPVPDPYDPAGLAWSLAEGFALGGQSVRVLYPGAAGGDAPETPVPSLPLAVGAGGAGEFARAAARGVRRDAEFVVRDPMGFGPLGLNHGPRRPRLVGIVRSTERAFLGEGSPLPQASGFFGKIEAWNAKRARRKLGRLAVREVDRLFADAPELAPILEREYGIDAQRTLPTAAPVPRGSPPPSRSEARRALTVPDDVPVVVMVAPPCTAASLPVLQVRDAFVGLRPIFPGVRLVVSGVAGVTGAGVSSVPRRDTASFVAVLAAADLAVLPGPSTAVDPGLVLALRAGVPSVILPGVRGSGELRDGVRPVASEDPRDLASTMTELLADPAGRGELSQRGIELAARFDPVRVAAELVAGDPAR